MAQVDIAGLLTGIPSLQDPITQGRINAANLPANASSIERTLERYRPQNEANMRRAVGGLLSSVTGTPIDLRTQGAKAREAMQGLNPTAQAGNPDMQKMLTALDSVAPQQAMALRQQLAQQQAAKLKEQQQRESLISQAQTLDLTSTVDLLQNNGDMKEAAEQIREEEKTTLLARRGRRAKTALATKANIGEAVIAQINNGAFDSLTPAQFIDNVLKGENATLKAFTSPDGKPVMRRVNDSGKIYNAETETWKNPSELQLSPAVAVNRNINEDASRTTELAYNQFTEAFEQAQDVPETWEANAQAEEALNLAFTGIGAEYKTSIAKVADAVGIPVFNNQEERITATEQFIINRARKTVQLLSTGAFGAGTGLSDNDVKFAEKVIAGDITLTKETLKRFLAIERQALQNSAKRSNSKLDLYLTASGKDAATYEGFRVAIPSKKVPTGVTVTRVTKAGG